MKISIFWVGVIISIIGIIWISFIYMNNNNEYSEFLLSSRESHIQEMQLDGEDLGYYKISVPSLSDQIFVQISNPQGNIIADKKIDAKISVNYFEILQSGLYTIKITNMSDHQFTVNSEFGNTNSEKMLIPGAIMLSGIMIVIFGTFRKLKNYKIAQPDENNS